MRTDSRVQVLSGLRPGDVVITTGLQQLRSGAVVDAMIYGGAAFTSGDPSRTTGGDALGVAATTDRGRATTTAPAVAFVIR